MGTLDEQIQRVDQFVADHKKEAAVNLLFDLIVKSAKKKDFEQAQALRQKLFDVDSMALDAIIKSAEIIEAEKKASIDQSHLSTWRELYDLLNPDEANEFYYAMHAADIEPDKMIFKQAELNTRLYFIDQGQLQMFYEQAGKRILLKDLAAGHFAGEDTFFSDAYCTTSLVTTSRARLHHLEKNALLRLKDKVPGFEPKLQAFCKSEAGVDVLLQRRGLERRMEGRLSVSGQALIHVLSETGQPEGNPFKGDLLDISASGLACMVKFAPKSANRLLGRKLNISLIFPQVDFDPKIRRIGKVLALTSFPFCEYIIHVDFVKGLNQRTVDHLVNLAANEHR
jgi:CRP-like cAMP-binding protein